MDRRLISAGAAAAARMILIVLAVGCGQDAPPAMPAPAPAARAIDAAPAPDPCPALVAEYSAAIDGADQRCTTDADCGCYQGGIGGKSGCGGVASTTTVAKLGEIAKRYVAASCRLTQACAAWRCAPHCVQGACER